MDIGSLSVQQFADNLERQRMNELKNAALGMKGTLVQNGRCPKCTLKPPCKHYERSEDIASQPSESGAKPKSDIFQHSVMPALQLPAP